MNNATQKTLPTYNYEWKDDDQIIANKNTKLRFYGWGQTTINEIADNPSDHSLSMANALWLKLQEAFNGEASNPNKYAGKLGSIGTGDGREVMRSSWFYMLEGEKYGDYCTLTRIIEALHGGEKLATGRIYFGS